MEVPKITEGNHKQPNKYTILYLKLILAITIPIFLLWIGYRTYQSYSAEYFIRRAVLADRCGDYTKALMLYQKSMTAYGWNKIPPALRFDIRRIIYFRSRGYTDNFKALVCSGFLYRWNNHKIRAFIPTDRNGFSQSIRQIILDSLDEWCHIISQPIMVEQVEDSNNADLIFTPKNDTQLKLIPDAITYWNAPVTQKLFVGQMCPRTIVIPNSKMPGFLSQHRHDFKYVCLHEIGHALGFATHSIFGDDVMFLSDSDKLSLRDIDTINQLYNEDAALRVEKILKDEVAKDNTYALVTLGRIKQAQGSYKQAVDYYMRAANLGFAEGQEGLGIMYYNGLGVSKNYQVAAQLYSQAAAQDLSTAQERLGYCYEMGQGVAKDLQQAFKYYKLATDQGNVPCFQRLAKMYMTGTGTLKDEKKALHLYQQAALDGDPEAEICLGYFYEHGQLLPQNSTEALHWYNAAAKQGNHDAEEKLRQLGKR